MKQLGIAAFTARGSRMADVLTETLKREYEIVRYEHDLKNWCGRLFASGADGIIFVGACGIAVRSIAPFLKSKTTDPAVVVIDEAGQFAISLLSGHIGGANRLAEYAAGILGATPVITTATDVNGKFAVDVFAKENHLRIGSMKAAKEISAAVLRGERIGLSCEGEIAGTIPPELYLTDAARIHIGVSPYCPASDPGTVTPGKMEDPEESLLNLYPKAYILGIGCRRGKAELEIAQSVGRALDRLGLCMEDIAGVASIDLKKEEPGLRAFCEERELPFETYSAERLSAVVGEFSPSSFVQNVTGVDNVCERAALCMANDMSLRIGAEQKSARALAGRDCSEGSGGRLLLKKQAGNGVTVAVAEYRWTVRFADRTDEP